MRQLIRFNARFWRPITLAIAATIITLSLTPLPELPLPEVEGGDKLHHFAAYAALALPASLARPRGWGWWLVGFLVLGGGIELVQPYANRYAEWADWAANAAGVGFGVLLGAALRAAAGVRYRD